MRPRTIEEAAEVLREFVAHHYPGRTLTELKLLFNDGKKMNYLLPAGPILVQTSPDQNRTNGDSFVPTTFQEEVLAALEGRALRTDALGNAVGDRSRLFRNPGGLKELRKYNLVKHHPRLGYYRPDAPPEELPNEDI